MIYKLIVEAPAQEFLEKLYYSDRSHFARVDKAIQSLQTNPFQGKPLQLKFKGRLSLRVGVYRIIYRIESHIITVVVLDVGHRKDIYN